MLTEPLPSTLDVRKAAAREVAVSGFVKPADLPRLQAMLAEDGGTIEAYLQFSRDQENRYLVRAKVEAEVAVCCQRCLESMPVRLASDSTLAIVWTDEQARHLPRQVDPLIVTEEGCSLWELVEEELILALPAFSYHDTADCKPILADSTGQDPAEETPAAKSNPFDVLAQLKPESKL